MSVPLALAAGVATLALLIALTGSTRARLRESVGVLPGVALACAAVLVAHALPGVPPWPLLGALGAAATAALLLTTLPAR